MKPKTPSNDPFINKCREKGFEVDENGTLLY